MGTLPWIDYEHVLEWGHYRGLGMSMYWNEGTLPWIEYEHALDWGHYRGLSMSMYWSGDITVD